MELHARLPALVVGCLLGAVALPAQTAAAFTAAHARFVAAPAEQRGAAAALASDGFLLLPAGDARTSCLVDGLVATVAAGRHALAIGLADEARAAGPATSELVVAHLTALLHAAPWATFVDRAVADLAERPAAVQAVLAAEEAKLLPLAEKALRAGDTSRGRFVFAELAAIEPVASYRLGNLALCLRQLGDLPAARAVYERARVAAPEDLELENDYGLFLRATGDEQGAVRAFTRAWQLDLARAPELRARGPAITNLLHFAATRPGLLADDPLPAAREALAVRPDATMLKRLVLDVGLDRLTGRRRAP